MPQTMCALLPPDDTRKPLALPALPLTVPFSHQQNAGVGEGRALDTRGLGPPCTCDVKEGQCRPQTVDGQRLGTWGGGGGVRLDYPERSAALGRLYRHG